MSAEPNQHVKAWVEKMARMVKPDRIYWCDGSEDEKKRLTAESLKAGDFQELNQQKHCRAASFTASAQNDVARTEHLTFICTPTKEQAGPTNNWMAPAEAYQKLGDIFAGSYKGRTMYVIPFIMGQVGSPFSKVAVELTDSLYVVLSMRIMTRMGVDAWKQLGEQRRFHPLPARQGRPVDGPAVHLPLPAGQHDLVGRLGLRRQRPARQEVPVAADRRLPGPQGRLARRAHAHRRPDEPAGRDALHRRRLPDRPAARPTWRC